MTPTKPNQNVTDNHSGTPVANTSYPANADELYLKHLPEVIAWASRKGVRDPDNFAQETMLRALRGFDPARSKFEQRLARMKRWNYAEEFRSHQHKFKATPPDDEVFEVPAEDAPLEADLWQIVRGALDHLEPLDRELAVQRFWEDRSITEIIALPQYAGRGLKPHQIKESYGRTRACLQRLLAHPVSDLLPNPSYAVRRSCQNPKRVRIASPKVPPARRKISDRPALPQTYRN